MYSDFVSDNLKETPIIKWYWFEDSFTDDERDTINSYAKNLSADTATVLDSDINETRLESYRKSEVRWIPFDDEIMWLYEKLGNMCSIANNNMWQFDLIGMTEMIQHGTYNDGGGHYDWHMDIGPDYYSRRKISVTVQLSDPNDYEGGDLQFLLGRDAETLPRKKGATIIFPSYFLHRVTPVTKGVRNSLVIWVSGPPYR